MRNLSLLGLPPAALSILCALGCREPALVDVPAAIAFHDGSVVRCATLGEGQELIGAPDDWVRSFGPFDFQVRLNSAEPVSEAEFLEFARSQVLAWDEDEVACVTKVVVRMQERLATLDLHLDLPDEILVVQTTGREEGGMDAYTRGQFIVVSESQLKDDDKLEELMLHELFHVMTRHAPEVRTPLYSIIGFSHGGALEYPAELLPRRITNPYAYHHDSFIELTVGGQPVQVTPLTLSRSKTYTGGGISENLAVQFLQIDVTDGGMVPRRVEGELVLYERGEVRGYLRKIGVNTFYTIHPEEILADNFSLAVRQVKSIPTPRILEQVIAALSAR